VLLEWFVAAKGRRCPSAASLSVFSSDPTGQLLERTPRSWSTQGPMALNQNKTTPTLPRAVCHSWSHCRQQFNSQTTHACMPQRISAYVT